MNFFVWIREGVKRSVLLGVSDAIEQIGVPADGDEGTQRLLTSLRQHMALEAQPGVAGGSGRKRLGRSLNQIQAEARGAT
jgi:hypothetical protein